MHNIVAQRRFMNGPSERNKSLLTFYLMWDNAWIWTVHVFPARGEAGGSWSGYLYDDARTMGMKPSHGSQAVIQSTHPYRFPETTINPLNNGPVSTVAQRRNIINKSQYFHLNNLVTGSPVSFSSVFNCSKRYWERSVTVTLVLVIIVTVSTTREWYLEFAW